MTSSPTGRLSVSEPNKQYFPGTPEAIAEERKLRAARQAMGDNPKFFDTDLSGLELRALASYLEGSPQEPR